MAKARKTQRNKKFNYNINRKKLWTRSKKKRAIKCEQIKEALDPGASLRAQMQQMGLVYDVNRKFPVPSLKRQLVARLKGEVKKPTKERAFVPPPKAYVAESIEEDAMAPRKRAKYKQPVGLVKMAVYFINKYGQDYEAMARDHKNYWQYTPGQLKEKLKVMKRMPENYMEQIKPRLGEPIV